ncbi:MAG: hypothetical protein OQK51_06070 [Kangiellaceae bacterium]|nr:hypothetical protein [Kangiellaceae bacterium]
MERTINVFDKRNNKLVISYPIILSGVNYEPSLQEYFDLAFENLVQDGLANEDDKEYYYFKSE